MALEQEIATFKANAAEIHRHPGEFVLIHRTELAGYFVAFEDALRTGYQRFRLEPFMVQEIESGLSIADLIQALEPLLDILASKAA